METLGRHIVVEFYDCNASILDDRDAVEALMIVSAQASSASVVGHIFHKFAPHGVSGTVVIAESHLSIHTWPEARYASADVYTCGGLDPWPAVDHIGKVLEAQVRRAQEIIRGLKEGIDAQRHLLPQDVVILPFETWSEVL